MRALAFVLSTSLCFIAAGAAARAQQDSTVSTFEVSSVKAHPGISDGSFVGRQPGGRLVAAAASLRELLEFAYNIQPFQLVNEPKWVDEERWDIDARMASGTTATPENLPGALASLLGTRFNLVLRREVRQMPIYALVPARADGRVGPQLTRSAIDCAALRAARAKGDTGPLPPAAQLCDGRGRPGSIQVGGSPLSALATQLAPRLQRMVVDRTGLQGTWDLTLTFTPDPSQITAGTLAQGVVPQFDPDAPSIFTALQEQLGLKLEPATGPVEVWVVERVERAKEN